MVFYDFLLPNRNEDILYAQAEKFDITPIFLYDFKSKIDILNKKNELREKKFNCYIGVYTIPSSVRDIKKITKLWLLADFTIILQPKELIKFAASTYKIDAIFQIPTIFGKDTVEYKLSYWDDALVKLAKKNGVCYGIDFSNILLNDGYARAKLLGREAQNVSFCKGKLPILIGSFARNPIEMRLPENLCAFGRILGLSAPEARAAISQNYELILKEKEERRSLKFVAPKIKLID
ncbi:MAG: RNase P subunit p30 family protein [Candidatus Nanoarchaeia archaeon]